MALKSPAVKELGYCVLDGTIYLSLDFVNVSVVVSGWWYISLLSVPSDSRGPLKAMTLHKREAEEDPPRHNEVSTGSWS